jgi:hypothetical protein
MMGYFVHKALLDETGFGIRFLLQFLGEEQRLFYDSNHIQNQLPLCCCFISFKLLTFSELRCLVLRKKTQAKVTNMGV